MSNLLIDDRPIMFLPMLAKALGSCERAIVLQQIHWLSRLPNSGRWDDEGLHWIWGTYADWCRDYFPMWSPHTLAKIIRKLEEMGVLISAQLRAREHDRTKFYRIDYRKLDTILPDQVGSIAPDQVGSYEPDTVASKEPEQVDSLYRTKTSAKTSQKKEDRPPSGRKGRSPDTPRPKYDLEHYPDL